MPDPLWIRIALGVLLLAIGARWWRSLHLERCWRRPIAGVPPELVTLWVSQDPRHPAVSPESIAKAPPTLSGIDVLFHLSRLDRRQMARFHPRTPAARFEQLLGQFDAKTRGQAEQQGEPEIGERLLAQQLSYDGHDVVLLASGNTSSPEDQLPGCNALVDGLRVRLVASADRKLVQQCLDSSSGAAVVTVADHAQAFAEHAKVVALGDLTYAEIAQATDAGTRSSGGELSTEAAPRLAKLERSKEQAAGLANSAEGKGATSLGEIGSLIASQAIPPALYTAYRTAQLAAKGDGTWLATAKNELVDTAASSVGGWAGGAMLGAILGPVGMVAGGLIGGILGSKFAADVTTNSKEKRLRQLLAEQRTLLAKVPRLAAAAWRDQARHLGSVVDETRRTKAGFELWPSAEKAARDQIAVEYRRWQRRVARQQRQLQAWLKDKPSAEKQSTRGAQLLSDGDLPWSKDFLEMRWQLMQLGPKIEAERARIAK